MASAEAAGEHLPVMWWVFDVIRHLVRSSFLEVWKADRAGVYRTCLDPERSFNGVGRTATTSDAGEWSLKTVKPGSVKSRAGQAMAPHISVSVFARGIN